MDVNAFTSFFVGIWMAISSIFVPIPSAQSEVTVTTGMPRPIPVQQMPAKTMPMPTRTDSPILMPKPAEPILGKKKEITITTKQGFYLGHAIFTPAQGRTCDSYTMVKTRDGVELPTGAGKMTVAQGQCWYLYASPCGQTSDTWLNIMEDGVIVGAIIIPQYCDDD